MLYDNEPLVNTYISLPREMSQLNCAAYVAGVIEGVCDGAGFATMGVSAHSVGEDGGGEAKGGMWPGKTVFMYVWAFFRRLREWLFVDSTGSGPFVFTGVLGWR
ncbi:hypothetical protein AOQ84DRAFT_316207 [Glonium stellatum]|uniref:Uncharacterized protein n=1 Tax=Glonium stellatum TaxID=574774 RepID=A0A8E2F3T5_9PEZI|nr:hypothetical protein AOQ84DRAFT_316207 [Glonium stellatum]